MPDAGGLATVSWTADRATYLRVHVLMAVVGAIGCTGILYFVGNPDYWVGAVAAFAAIAVRGWYLASEELTLRWDLTRNAVQASSGKRVALADIKTVRSLGSAVQLITHGGDKHLMKYLADPAAVKAAIARAAGAELQ